MVSALCPVDPMELVMMETAEAHKIPGTQRTRAHACAFRVARDSEGGGLEGRPRRRTFGTPGTPRDGPVLLSARSVRTLPDTALPELDVGE